jgi:hypothetical protein
MICEDFLHHGLKTGLRVSRLRRPSSASMPQVVSGPMRERQEGPRVVCGEKL